jgi:hypothetical protein
MSQAYKGGSEREGHRGSVWCRKWYVNPLIFANASPGEIAVSVVPHSRSPCRYRSPCVYGAYDTVRYERKQRDSAVR